MLFILAGFGTAKAETIVLQEGVNVAGPMAGVTVDYEFTATRDGVLTFAHTFTGAIISTLTVNGEKEPKTSSVVVKNGDVARFSVCCEEDNSMNTITVVLDNISEGVAPQTAFALAEGANAIAGMKSGDTPRWYRFAVPAKKRGKLTFTGYPTLNAYVGEELAVELGTNNPVDYINNSASETEVFVKLSSTNSEDLTATLEYSAPIADLTKFNQPVFSVAEGGRLEQGTPVTVSFPNREGGADTDVATVDYYIFSVAGSAPTGAPLNLGGETQATGTLAGIDINYNFSKGRKYQVKIQNIHSGNHYAPSADEQTIVGDAVIFTVVAGQSGIEVFDAHETTAAKYNLAGQKVGKNHKGIVITEGKKIINK